MIGEIKYLGAANKKTVLTLEVGCEPNVLEQFLGKQVTVEIKKYSPKRSLDANAYFHVLVDKLRQVNGISFAHQKNDLITHYGQILYLDDGQPFIYKTNAPPEFMQEQETIHMILIKYGDDGAFWYKAYRGSHEYNVEEMSKLIDGTVLEANEAGIETATPAELSHMKELWRSKYDKH